MHAFSAFLVNQSRAFYCCARLNVFLLEIAEVLSVCVPLLVLEVLELNRVLDHVLAVAPLIKPNGYWNKSESMLFWLFVTNINNNKKKKRLVFLQSWSLQ